MPLVSIKPILAEARKNGYAIGAFNPVDYGTMKAIVRAAEKLEAPVIIQTSAKTVRFWSSDTLFLWMQELASDSHVPVAFHLDHGKDIDLIKECIEMGWTSVMIDASDLPFEENMERTRLIYEIAEAKGVGIEAELGEIGGVEEDIVVAEEDAHLADPEKAVEFCEAFDLGVFAPAIGTAHGIYKGEPRIAFDRLEEMSRRISTPFALHGGTGLSNEVIQKCIRLGCAKVNISTNLKYAFIDGFCNYHRDHPDDYEPLRLIKAQTDAVEAVVSEKIQQFGGAGKAQEMLRIMS